MCIDKIHKLISISINKEVSFLYTGIYIYGFISQRSLYSFTGTHRVFHSLYVQIMHPCYMWMFSVRQKKSIVISRL